jgi:glucan phosphoethanolaminetransferase (alkaline phosphatase superfamily)
MTRQRFLITLAAQIVIFTLLWFLLVQRPVRTVGVYFLMLWMIIVISCLIQFVIGRIYKTQASKQEIDGPKQMTRNQKIVFFTFLLLLIGLPVMEIVLRYRSTGKVPWLDMVNSVLQLGFVAFVYAAETRKKRIDAPPNQRLRHEHRSKHLFNSWGNVHHLIFARPHETFTCFR